MVVLGLAALVGLVSGCAQAVPTPKPHQPDLDPYISFLETQKQAPVDYLLALFDRCDLVIIDEYELAFAAGFQATNPAHK